MREPDFIEQSPQPDRDRRWAWMVATAQAAAETHGCAFYRVSFDAKTLTCLMEGWVEKPDDCGEPRWQR